MSARHWLPVVVGCVLFASCEPRTVEIPGLDELTAEIRSQRLQNRDRGAASGTSSGASPEVRGEQIKAALSPLRDVLTQLGTSQRELSTRQATLTQEMRRWTQLLVQSMQSERNEEATKLSERLAELEKTISEQDKRHRKVEALLGSALDHTADQLELFLKRVGADTGSPVPEADPETGTTGRTPTPAGNPTSSGNGEPGANNATPTPATGGAKPGNTEATTPKTGAGDPAGGTLPSGQPARTEQPGVAGVDKASQAGSMAWLWGLAILSLLSGFALLFGKRRTRPVAMAPEMQYAPHQEPSNKPTRTAATVAVTPEDSAQKQSEDLRDSEAAIRDLVSGDLAIEDASGREFTAGAPANADPAAPPQVEELWAAAALLGEAIGRLKQTGEAIPPELGGEHPLPEAPDELLAPEPPGQPAEIVPGHGDNDEVELDDFFVIDEEDEADEAMFADPVTQPTADHEDQPLDITGAFGTEFEAVQALGLPNVERPPQPAAEAPTKQPYRPAEQPVETPEHIPGEVEPVAVNAQEAAPSTPASTPLAGSLASGQPAARHASSSPITCHLNLPGDERAEGRVRSILGRDPRVLITPAPQIRTGMGELEVSFALLPGLTAGERSLLEQQLRDTVA